MDHLTQALDGETSQDSQEDALQRLVKLAQLYKEKNAELEAMQEELKAKKASFNKLSQEIIPSSMQELGLTAFNLETGECISYKEDISVTVKDYAKLAKFLDERGDSAILKITLEIGKVPENILSKIVQMLAETFDIYAEAKMFVHPMTLKKYVKELCGIGGTEAQMTLSEIDEDMLKPYLYYKTVVK